MQKQNKLSPNQPWREQRPDDEQDNDRDTAA